MPARPARSPHERHGRAEGVGRVRRLLGARSLSRPQIVGLVLVALLLVLCFFGVQAVLIKTGQEAAESERQVAAYTPPPLPLPTADVAGSVIAVVGDESVSRAGASVSPDERWPAVLEQRADVDISESTSVGGGFVERGRSGRFAELAQDVPLGADVVFFVGGVADAADDPADVTEGLASAIATARERAPTARIVVVGPVLQGDAGEIEFSRLRSTLQAGAAASGATSVDPFAAEWLQLQARRAASTDDLTVADETAIANRMQALLGTVLSGS